MRRRASFVAAVSLAALSTQATLVGLATPAAADSTTRDAEQLFEQARILMADGRFAEACVKLEDSEAIDPGIGTEFNLGRCYELAGRFASARAMYQRVIAETHAAGETERENVTLGLAAALEPRVPHVRIEVASPESSLEVRLDGLLIPASDWSSPLPVDEGAHDVVARADLAQRWKTVIQVDKEGETVTVNVPVLAPALALQPVPPPASLSPAPSPTPESSPEKPFWGGQRITAIVLGALSVVGIGFGTYFGLRASSLASQADPLCNAQGCDPAGFSLRSDSRSSGDASTVSFTLAGAALVAAGVMWLTAPSGH